MPLGPRPRPLDERIRESVVVDPDTSCWVWQKRRVYDYGRIWVGSRTDGTRRQAAAHRVAYEVFVGPIPDDLSLDHLCRNPPCVNPAHLEPVTTQVNLLRGEGPVARQAKQTHCKDGHEFTPENTYVNRGKRYCRTCRRGKARVDARRRREAQARADRDGVKVSAVVRAALAEYVSEEASVEHPPSDLRRCWECGARATRRDPTSDEVGCDDCYPHWPQL